MAILFSSPSLLSLRASPCRLRLLQFQAQASSASDFNISFSPLTKKNLNPSPQNPNPNPSTQPLPLLIPWIVRDDAGNLKVQSTPPAPFLHAMAEAKERTLKKESIKKKKKKEMKAAATAGSAAASSKAPAYSKAARRFYNERIREPQRLSKVLAAAGVASRRGSEELIFGGKVTVNGSVCTSPQTRVDILKDSIYVNGNRLPKKLPPKLYFALNKPKGYICSSGEESKSVVSLFDGFWKTWNKTNPGVPKPLLFTVGRLDVATTGLIIVTNDGDFAQSLAHPSSELSKE